MKQVTINKKLILVVTTFFILPTAYFILSASLKFEFGFAALYDVVEPLLINLGLRENIGWNINLLILFGPVVALALAIYSNVRIRWVKERHLVSVLISVKKYPLNIVVMTASVFLIAFLLIYAIGENCFCR